MIANTLQTRKERVIIVSKEAEHAISLTTEQLNTGEEIENLLVAEIIKKHNTFVTKKLL